MNPTYTLYYSDAKLLLDDLEVAFKTAGWYRKGDDFILIVPDPSDEQPNQLCVCIWNNHDPRPFWRRATVLPEFKIEGGDVLNV